MIELPIATPDGEFLASYTTKGLAALRFPPVTGKPDATSAGPEIRRWHQLTALALKQMLLGKVPGEFPPLDDSSGTDFQRAVWQAMRKIPTGRTQSYGELAAAIGRPQAVRAVGGACGANPIPVLVPCHRVLAAGNKIGGFSSGLDWKRKLLAREGVTLL